jgi:hypothetical protein
MKVSLRIDRTFALAVRAGPTQEIMAMTYFVCGELALPKATIM